MKNLPFNRCLFCKNVTDTIRKCETCGIECGTSCTQCHALGAPRLHYPRKMARIENEDGRIWMCHPQCTRKYAAKCKGCGKWKVVSMVYKIIRQNENVAYCICNDCKKSYGVCAFCHQVSSVSDFHNSMYGKLCSRCNNRNYRFIDSKKTIVPMENDKRTFGIEVEIANVHRQADLSRIVDALYINGVEYIVKGDGSVSSGFEIVSTPATYRQHQTATRELCDVVQKFKHDYNGCGLHVHVKDGTDPVALFKTWIAFEPFTFSLLPRFRRSESYAKPIFSQLAYQGYSFDSAIKYIDGSVENALQIQAGRYHAINLQSLAKHGTVEIRCHQGTADNHTIISWMRYIAALSDYAKENGNNAILLGDIFKRAMKDENIIDLLQLPNSTKEKMNKRREYYSFMNDNSPLKQCKFTDSRSTGLVRLSFPVKGGKMTFKQLVGKVIDEQTECTPEVETVHRRIVRMPDGSGYVSMPPLETLERMITDNYIPSNFIS